MPNIPSTAESIHFPAFPNQTACQMLAMQFQLQQSQYWSTERRRARQFGQLKALLLHSQKTVPFYRNRIKQHHLRFPDPFNWSWWQQLPILSRQQIQQAGKSLESTALPRSHGSPLEIQTSGSTGKPIKVLTTDVTRYLWQVFALRDHLWHQRDFSLKHAFIRPEKLQLSGNLENWGLPVASITKTGPAALLNSKTDISKQAKWLNKQNPAYLLSLPSNLLGLLDEFQRKGWTLPKLKEVRSYGEAIPDSLISRCRDEWQAPVTDTYSAQEVGMIAMQHPDTSLYHIQEENLLVEVVNKQGKHCKAGEVGRVLLTALHNFATPLIRYEIEDYAQVAEINTSAIRLPALKRIIGRQRNLLTLADGSQHWPTFPARLWSKVADIRQFQLRQKSTSLIEVHLVPVTPLSPAQEQTLKAKLAESLKFPFNIQLIYQDKIPRGANGKFEDFISEL